MVTDDNPEAALQAPTGSEAATGPGARSRIESGIPRLDYILGGGFFRRGLYAIFGPPGSGKTIFANQLCFNLIRDHGAKCVYITLLSESHSKMVAHLTPLEFFDAGRLGNELLYLSAYQQLKQGGLSGVLDFAQRLLRQNHPDLLVFDGMESIIDLAGSRQERREFIHELQAVGELTGCTILLLATSNLHERSAVEDTLADGVLEFSDTFNGPRAVKELSVLKFRGSRCLHGRHEVEISDAGMQIHPRTEVQFADPPRRAMEQRQRIATGVAELDRLMSGGIPSGSSLALLGAPGTGKTTLGLHFLCEGAATGQKGIFFGFQEPPPRLIEKAESLGFPLRRYVDDGLIRLLWQPPLERFLDSLSEQVLEEFRSHTGDKRRLFVDGLEGFRAASIYPDRMRLFFAALINQLRVHDVTTIFSEELTLSLQESANNELSARFSAQMPETEIATIAESAVWLRPIEVDARVFRLLSVMKMRESAYTPELRQFEIGHGGIRVAPSADSARALLAAGRLAGTSARGGAD